MGRAWARGSCTWIPPCMMGAVIMKMMSSTSATSTRLVMLTSAMRENSSRRRRRRPRMLEPPLPRQRADELAGEALQLPVEGVHPPQEEVVGDDRRDGHYKPAHGGNEGL